MSSFKLSIKIIHTTEVIGQVICGCNMVCLCSLSEIIYAVIKEALAKLNIYY